MAASLKLGLFVAIVLACYCGIQSSPVSFPDSGNSGQSQVYHKNGPTQVNEEAAPEGDNITPPAPEAAESGDEEDPTVAQIVDRVPQILDRIQNYINSAISSYASNDTAPNQPPAQLNQFLGLVDGFISVTNNFAQQFLQPAATAAAGENVEGQEAGVAAAAVENNNNV